MILIVKMNDVRVVRDIRRVARVLRNGGDCEQADEAQGR
jgi:hypothetical protein